jgi:hypothetical protein
MSVHKISVTVARSILYGLAEYMGKFGWTVPYSTINGFFNGALKHDALSQGVTVTNEEISSYFMSHYSEDNNFDLMINSIMNNSEIKQCHQAIEQSVYAYKNNMFILSISTLIPVLEGILSTFEEDKTNIRMIKVCKEMVDAVEERLTIDPTNLQAILNKTLWISCYHFITALYQKSDFSGAEPEMINRHWILHGRTAFNNSQIDSIRIFNAIETVSSIVRIHNSLNKTE